MDLQLRHPLVGLKVLDGSHTGESVAEVISTIIEEFAIEPKLGVFVADNAANCDSACRALVKQFRPYKSENSRRSRCLGHILHLAARKLIYGGDSEAFIIKAEQIE